MNTKLAVRLTLIKGLLNLAITDLKGPTMSIYYRRISTIAVVEKKEKNSLKGPKNCICYKRYSLIRYSGILLY